MLPEATVNGITGSVFAEQLFIRLLVAL